MGRLTLIVYQAEGRKYPTSGVTASHYSPCLPPLCLTSRLVRDISLGSMSRPTRVKSVWRHAGRYLRVHLLLAIGGQPPPHTCDARRFTIFRRSGCIIKKCVERRPWQCRIHYRKDPSNIPDNSFTERRQSRASALSTPG